LPDIDASELIGNEYVAPANEMELELAATWKEILKVDQVGVTDNFFELGGHSLNAIQLTSRLHKRLNVKIDIGTIFSNPTIR
jgi:acyl carrier protein